MRIAICQLNPTVGDLDGNRVLVREAVEAAVAAGATVAVLPELVLPGYPPLDLLERPTFLSACREAERELIAELPEGIVAIFGNIAANPSTVGRPLLNVAVLARRGERIGRVAKTLLPTYDVFDEARYFEPNPGGPPAVFELAGKKVGVTVCEDIWNDEILDRDTHGPWDDSSEGNRIYRQNPVTGLVEAGAEIIVNLSASPWSRSKLDLREGLVSHLSRHHRVWCIYANTVGANDGLIFDGQSIASNPDGEIVARLPGWVPETAVLDLDAPGLELSPRTSEIEDIRAALVLGVRDYFEKTGIPRAVIGLSGGIDSAVTCAVAVEALGKDRVIGVAMPSKVSSGHSVEDAAALAKNLGIEYFEVPIEAAVSAFETILAEPFAGRAPDVTEENIQSRVRGTTLMAVANKRGGAVLGTGNKSEASMGYATLYGDTIGAISVLADLYKHQVYALAHCYNAEEEVVPARTIEKPPSAELRPGQKDSDSLPDYAILDGVLERIIEQRMSAEAIASDMSIEPELAQGILRKVYFNEFKRKQMPPTLRICRKAWVGRVYPIVQRFRR